MDTNKLTPSTSFPLRDAKPKGRESLTERTMSARRNRYATAARWHHGRSLIAQKRNARALCGFIATGARPPVTFETLRAALYFFVGLRPRDPRVPVDAVRRADILAQLREHETASREKSLRALIGAALSVPLEPGMIAICSGLERPQQSAHWRVLAFERAENVAAAERQLEELGMLDRRQGVALIYVDGPVEFVRAK